MKGSVPGTAKISKEAKECVQECVSEFISFITSEAAEKCQMEKRKTIGGEDILYAMITLGFENYAETLKIHLAKLRQVSVESWEWERAGGRVRLGANEHCLCCSTRQRQVTQELLTRETTRQSTTSIRSFATVGRLMLCVLYSL